MNARLLSIGAALAASLLLAACSDPPSDEVPIPAQEVPDSALASPAAYTSFAQGLAADDGAGPLSLDRVDMAPTSETDEPASLN